MVQLVEYMAKALVDHPEDVQVTEEEQGKTTVIRLQVNPAEIGRVIGHQGKIANAIRAIVRSASAGKEKRYTIDIVEND
ncbi:MAG: KH domain-containing protein [Eubacteriales bacterium]|nr:KH domain-containing protein [Eubacteriales bacterium]